MPTTTTNHSYLKDSRASGSSTQKVINALIDDLDTDVPDSGDASFDGDAANTTFTIAHGLPYTPSRALVVPTSADAAADHYVSGVDATNITVEYVAAPGSGTDNVTLSWSAYP